MLETASEFITVILSSAGLTGTLFTAILSYLFRKAKRDAEDKRQERMQLEILRLEGEEKLSELLFTLLRYSRSLCSEQELLRAENAYYDYIESSRKLKNSIIGRYTSK